MLSLNLLTTQFKPIPSVVCIALVLSIASHLCSSVFTSGSRRLNSRNYQMAVAYDAQNDTVLLFGGLNSAKQFTTFKAHTFTLVSDTFLRDSQKTYGLSQYYTQLNHELWTINKDGSGFIKINTNTYRVWEPTNITIPTVIPGGECLTSIDNYLFVIGGDDQSSSYGTVQILRISDGQWLPSVPSLNTGRTSLSCVVLDDTVYAIAGFDWDNTASLDTIETLDVSDMNAISAQNWNFFSDVLSTACDGTRAVVVNTAIWVIGGWDFNYNELSDVNVIDTLAQNCYVVDTLSFATSFAASILVRNVLYVFGGCSSVRFGDCDGNNRYQYTTFPTPQPTSAPTRITQPPSESTSNPTSVPTRITLSPSAPLATNESTMTTGFVPTNPIANTTIYTTDVPDPSTTYTTTTVSDVSTPFPTSVSNPSSTTDTGATTTSDESTTSVSGPATTSTSGSSTTASTTSVSEESTTSAFGSSTTAHTTSVSSQSTTSVSGQSSTYTTSGSDVSTSYTSASSMESTTISTDDGPLPSQTEVTSERGSNPAPFWQNEQMYVVIGGSAGGVCILGVLLCAVLCYRKRNKGEKEDAFEFAAPKVDKLDIEAGGDHQDRGRLNPHGMAVPNKSPSTLGILEMADAEGGGQLRMDNIQAVNSYSNVALLEPGSVASLNAGAGGLLGSYSIADQAELARNQSLQAANDEADMDGAALPMRVRSETPGAPLPMEPMATDHGDGGGGRVQADGEIALPMKSRRTNDGGGGHGGDDDVLAAINGTAGGGGHEAKQEGYDNDDDEEDADILAAVNQTAGAAPMAFYDDHDAKGYDEDGLEDILGAVNRIFDQDGKNENNKAGLRMKGGSGMIDEDIARPQALETAGGGMAGGGTANASGENADTFVDDPLQINIEGGNADYNLDSDGAKEVREWLESIGYGMYSDVFIQNAFDSMDLIKEINAIDDLNGIGISLRAHQLKIVNQIRKLKK